MTLLPVALNLAGKRVLVVGGGLVAERKARACLECEARVTVISPDLCDCFAPLHDRFEHLPRVYEANDVAGFSLVFACTNRREVNAQVAEDARARGIWCNIADDMAGSDLHGAATVRRGDIFIGITTSGGSPALARHLKAQVGACVGDEYAALLDLMSAHRSALKSRGEQPERADAWRAVLNSNALELLRAEKRDEAERLIANLLKADS